MIARVATEVSADRLFDYAVPEDLAPRLRAGQRVRVPFGRKFVDAYVIELRDATAVWGKDSHETTDELLKLVGDPAARVSCISTCGENLSRLAAIMNEKDRAAGRSGVGAVMGSKNLKAVVVRGTGKVEAYNGDFLKEAVNSGEFGR